MEASLGGMFWDPFPFFSERKMGTGNSSALELKSEGAGNQILPGADNLFDKRYPFVKGYPYPDAG